LLIVAFALSLLLHAVIATRVWWQWPASQEKSEVITVQRLRVAHVIRTPVPIPPSPHPTAAPTSAATAKPAPLGKGSRAVGGAIARATTPPPQPSVAPSVNCVTQDAPVSIVASPPPPDIAAAVRASAFSGVARVRVDVDPHGAVTATSMVDSTGNSSLDLVVVSMARAAQYAPATHACKPASGSYVFAAKFSPW
jgi:TonB family protein